MSDDNSCTLTEGACHSIHHQWSSQCSISPSHWTSSSRVYVTDLLKTTKCLLYNYYFRARPFARQPKLLSVENYLFVEQPSDDFFCPVTFGLLLHPYLTSCCGNHLSEEAASRIQREEGACPLCKKKDWSTMLSKHFQRQVHSLCVFCRHKDRGCGWQGELAAFHPHVNSCPMRDGPPMTELVKLPV